MFCPANIHIPIYDIFLSVTHPSFRVAVMRFACF